MDWVHIPHVQRDRMYDRLETLKKSCSSSQFERQCVQGGTEVSQGDRQGKDIRRKREQLWVWGSYNHMVN